MRYYISDLKNYVGQKVELRGWVYNLRSSGKVKFLVLRDGTGLCQCVFFKGPGEGAANPEAFGERFEKLTQESSVKVIGTVREEKRSPGGYELSAEDLEIYQVAEEYPITPKEHGTDFLMNQSPSLAALQAPTRDLTRVRAEIISAVRDFFRWPWLHPHGRADFHAERVRRNFERSFETQYFDEKALLVAKRSAVHGSNGRGIG